MRRKILALSLALLVPLVVTAGVTLYARQQEPETQNGRPREAQRPDSTLWALVDTTASMQSEGISRRNKGKKYDTLLGLIGPGVVGAKHVYWPKDFPALPVSESDAVVIGDVTEAKAYLSSNETNVYSEFTIHIDQILTPDKTWPWSKETQ